MVRKLEFIANKESVSQTSTDKKNTERKEIAEHQQVSTGDEFADLIINELGGEEIG